MVQICQLMMVELFQILFYQAIQGKNITVNGTGKQTRSFLYVDDLINGLTAVMSIHLIIIIRLILKSQ